MRKMERVAGSRGGQGRQTGRRFRLAALKARLAHEQRLVDGDMTAAESLSILRWDLDDVRSQRASLLSLYGDPK
jgi:hypothetical protein